MNTRSRFPLLQFAIVVAFVALILPATALAQGVAPVAVLTPYTVLVTVLTLLAGVLTTAVNTSQIAGKQIPASVMVWLMIVAPFVAAVGASFTAAGSLSALSAFNALVAGIVAVTAGATPGAVVHLALHAHLQVPKIAASFRSNAGKVGAALLLVGGLGTVQATESGCAQVQAAFPVLNEIEQTVQADLEQGRSDPQIASDVCADLGGSSLTDAICADVETLVQDAIDLLIAGKYLSPAALERAHGYQARHPRASTAPAGSK